MLCFYHSADLDGHCSGAIIKNKFPECMCYGANYNQPFKWELINSPDETVYMVDFSLPIDDMIKLNSMCNLIWIDHHNTAINDYNSHNVKIEGLREIGLAGCELTYQYIHKTIEIPMFVKLLGRYDVWDHVNPDVLPFQYGMGCYTTFPNNEIWVELLNNPDKVYDIITAGKIIENYIINSNKRICKTASFDVDFEGYHFLAINRAFINSKFFDSKYDNTIYDGMMAFSYNSKANKWGFSLYTDKDIDLSIIAKKYGGGGHKQACGFALDTPKFLEVLKLS